MYPRIYLSTESNFEHNGLGVLRDIVECYVEEEHNSFFELVMKYRVGGVLFDYLSEGNVIKADASDRLKGQLFRIHKTIKKSDSLIEVRANHISYDLMNDVVKKLDIKSQSCEYCLNEIFRQSDFCTHFVGHSDIEHSGDFSVEFTDCMSAIVGVSGSIVDTFGNGAEILRDNFDISVLSRRGKDDNVLIAYKKNMLGIEIEEDKTDLVTRIYPFAKLTVDNVETVYKPSFEYIDSDNIKLYEHPYTKFMDFSDKFEEGQTPTDEDFRNMCVKYFRNNKCDIPKVNYKVQFIPLANTENYKDSYKVLERVGLMDSVLVKDTRFNIDTEAKVVRTKYDVIRGIYEEIELGSINNRLNDFIQGEQGRPGQDGADGADGAQGPQGIPGLPGRDGVTYYTWIRYADNELGYNMSNHPLGKTHIGIAYNQLTEEESDNPQDYKWSKFVGDQGIPGKDGSDGTPGLNGSDGKTYYTYIKYALNDKGAGMSDSPVGMTHIGISYNNLSPVESTNPKDYAWSKFVGEDGKDGQDGIPGLNGSDGVTYYTWIRYADDEFGNGMSNSPENKDYIGIAYNKLERAESEDASLYAWSLIKGEQGVAGLNGLDGKTYFTWIKYSANANGVPMQDSPDNMKYMGIAYNKETKEESNNPKDYRWSLIKGQDGTTFYTWIKFADNILGDGLSDDSTGKDYIGIAYNMESQQESTDPSLYTWTKIRGDVGLPGEPGNDGKTLYTWIKFANNANGDGISDNPEGKTHIGFAYNKEEAKESNNPKDYVWSKYVGEKGEMGPQGIPGLDGANGVDGVTLYTWIRYADDEKGTNMSNLPTGKDYIGIAHNKTSRVESTNPNDYVWSKLRGEQGIQGIQGIPGLQGAPGIDGKDGQDGKDGVDGKPGQDGKDGQDATERYMWVKYADDNKGTNMSDSPLNKDYIGLAYNKTTPIESNNASDYAWSLVKGATGSQGLPGINGENGKTFYVWIKYSANANGVPMSDSPENMKYIGIAYNKESKQESSNASDYTWSLIKGNDGTTFYTWIKYSNSPNGDNMSDDSTNKEYIGIAYNKTTATESNNPSDYTWTKLRGDQGLPGPSGANGKTLYTWVKYADNVDGLNMSDNPENKSYLGLAFNKETQQESTNPKDYTWSKIRGEDGQDGQDGKPGQDGEDGKDGDIESFPDTLPSTPTLKTQSFFSSISLSWTFENKLYYNYELYASQTKNFTPSSANLLCSGQLSAFMHNVSPSQTWYYRVRCVNSHGRATNYSAEVSGSTFKLNADNIGNYMEEATIKDALIGELRLDRGWVGKLSATYLDAKNLTVTDGNGKRTLDIDSFGNVKLIVTELSIGSDKVETEKSVANKINEAKKEMSDTIDKEINDMSTAINNTINNLEDALSDSILTESEKASIREHIEIIKREKADIVAQVEALAKATELKNTTELTALNKAYSEYLVSFEAFLARLSQVVSRKKGE
jgi:phage minor structural protein